MINRGKAVLASLGNVPNLGATVAPPDAENKGPLIGPNGRQMFRLVPRPGAEGFSTLASELNQWLQGDLSFLSQPPGPYAVKPDKDKRKRDAMADVLDGKSR